MSREEATEKNDISQIPFPLEFSLKKYSVKNLCTCTQAHVHTHILSQNSKYCPHKFFIFCLTKHISIFFQCSPKSWVAYILDKHFR